MLLPWWRGDGGWRRTVEIFNALIKLIILAFDPTLPILHHIYFIASHSLRLLQERSSLETQRGLGRVVLDLELHGALEPREDFGERRPQRWVVQQAVGDQLAP